MTPSATKVTLSLNNVTETQAGPYFLVASDGSGLSVTSRIAVLEVDPQFTKQTTGQIVTESLDGRSAAWGTSTRMETWTWR